MELSDLTADEHIALVALLELIIESNARVSEAEADRIDAIVEAIGEDAYRRAAAEVDSQFHDEQDVRTYVATITRQEARELIYGTVFDAAITDAVDSHESDLLEWLAGTWQITARTAE